MGKRSKKKIHTQINFEDYKSKYAKKIKSQSLTDVELFKCNNNKFKCEYVTQAIKDKGLERIVGVVYCDKYCFGCDIATLYRTPSLCFYMNS